MLEGGVIMSPKLRDIIYGRPQHIFFLSDVFGEKGQPSELAGTSSTHYTVRYVTFAVK